MYSFIQQSYWVSTNVLDTVLGSENTTIHRTNKCFCLSGAYYILEMKNRQNFKNYRVCWKIINAMKKGKQGRKIWGYVGIWYNKAKETFTDMVTSKWESKRSHADIWRKSILAKGRVSAKALSRSVPGDLVPGKVNSVYLKHIKWS